MIRSFPFKSIKGDRKYCADDFALHDKTLYTSGILGNQNNNLQVFSDKGMSIKLSPGFALIEGHTFVNTNDYIIDVDYASNRFNRIDRLVLRLDHTEREIKPVLKKGSEASNPRPEDLIQGPDIFEIALADITVERGATSITQGFIRDLRHTSLCGISSFRGQPINVSDIYIQYEHMLEDIKDNFDKYSDEQKDKILNVLNQLNDILESENMIGEFIVNLQKKQDKFFKDEINNKEYQLVFKNGQLYKREVK